MQESKISLSGFIHTQAQGNIQEMIIYVYLFLKDYTGRYFLRTYIIQKQYSQCVVQSLFSSEGKLSQQENMSVPFFNACTMSI